MTDTAAEWPPKGVAVSHMVAEWLVELPVCHCDADIYGQFCFIRQAFLCPRCGNWKPETELHASSSAADATTPSPRRKK